MSVKQQKEGKWLCNIDRKGIPRVRKQFLTQISAEIFQREYLASHLKQSFETTDKRTLKELVGIWHKNHGFTLSDEKRVKNCLMAMSDAMGNPQATQFTAEQFVNYRYNRLKKITAKTFNNQHGYLSAMFNMLKELKIIDYDNPISDIKFIKIDERQLSYLSLKQIDHLLDTIKTGCINKSVWYVAQLCLRTGARWGEAEKLTLKQLINNLVTYEFTKSKKTRSIPIDKNFFKQIIKFSAATNPNDRVFINCISAYRRAVKRSKIEMPRGQSSHILRHSFASHFIMNGGNIVILQRILGHSDIRITMRYAHLSPDHLLDAIKLNPMAPSSVPEQGTEPE